MTYTTYPNGIDTTTQLPIAVDRVTGVRAEVVNRHRDAILAVENELGVNPSGTFGTVKARLDSLELAGSSSSLQTYVSCNSSVASGDLVYFNSSGVAQTASSSSISTAPAVAYVISKNSSISCLIQILGYLNLSGLTPGARYFLSSSGKLTTSPTVSAGYVVQTVGYALTSTVFVLNPSLNITIL